MTFFFLCLFPLIVGIITSARLMEDRRLMAGSGTRINTVASSSSALLSASSAEGGPFRGGMLGSGNLTGGPISLASRNRSLSKHSLLEIVTSRISGGSAATEGGGGNAGGSSSSSSAVTTGLKGNNKRFSRESFSAACVTKASQPPALPVLGPSSSSKDEASIELIPSTTRRSRDARRRDLKKRWEAGARLEAASSSAAAPNSSPSAGRSGCRWTFVFDPAGRLCYYWSLVVSLAFLYNFWVLIYRFAFQVRSDPIYLLYILFLFNVRN